MHHPGLFPATQWTQISNARGEDNVAALEAMDSLARAYKQPLYVLARQRGLFHEEAEDAVQEFLSRFLTTEEIRKIERRDTRFRTFLCKAFSNMLSNLQRRENTVKRGGCVKNLSFEELNWFRDEPIDGGDTPEEAFDRRWARVLYDRAMDRLSIVWDNSREGYFEAVRDIAFGQKAGSLGEIAGRFQMSATALCKAASRLKNLLGKLLRLEVERVVSEPGDVESELRYLLTLLARH